MIPDTRPRNSILSLYVSGLDKSVQDGQLYEKFKDAGLVSLRICRDATTGQSLGYGYLNFSSHEKAAQALQTMNFIKIKGRPIQLTWIQRDPSIRRSGIGNLFIKKIPEKTDIVTLYKQFEKYGNILSSKISCTEDGKSKGYGFVQYDKVESANRAIQGGVKIDGVKLEIREYDPQIRNRKERNEGAKNFTNIYIKNLSENFDDKDLYKLFKDCGHIVSHKVMSENGKSKGFGFVAFKTTEAAKLAIQKYNGIERDGKTLYVGPAQTKAERAKQLKREYEEKKKKLQESKPGFNIFVKNLPDNLNDEGLKKLFKDYGTVVSAKVKLDKSGNSRNFGFVWFSSIDEAQKAIACMNGECVQGKSLFVSMAQLRKDRTDLLKTAYESSQYSKRSPSSQLYVLPAEYQPQRLVNPQQFSRLQPKPRWLFQPQIHPGFDHGVGGPSNNIPIMAGSDSLQQLQNPNKYMGYM